MANGWFQRKLGAASKRSLQAKVAAIPDGLWIQCPGCHELLFTRELERNLKVCKKCNHHFRLTAAERLALLLDPGSFVAWDAQLRTGDRRQFPNSEACLVKNQEKTGMSAALVSATDPIDGRPLSVAVTDSQ